MRLDYRSWLEFLFPLSEDERQFHGVTGDDFLEHAHITQFHQFTSLSSFQDPTIRAAIHLVKYHHHRHAIKLLATLMSQFYYSLDNQPIIVPIPLSAKRHRTRGYNQVTEVLKITNLPYRDDILKRTRQTPPQTSLNRPARLKNVEHAFSISNQRTARTTIERQHIIVLDDVATTGATLRAAAAPLLPLNPTSLTCVAFAH